MVLMRLLCLLCLLHDLSQDGECLVRFARSCVVKVVAPALSCAFLCFFVLSCGSGSFIARDVPVIFLSEHVEWHGSCAGRQILA